MATENPDTVQDASAPESAPVASHVTAEIDAALRALPPDQPASAGSKRPSAGGPDTPRPKQARRLGAARGRVVTSPDGLIVADLPADYVDGAIGCDRHASVETSGVRDAMRHWRDKHPTEPAMVVRRDEAGRYEMRATTAGAETKRAAVSMPPSWQQLHDCSVHCFACRAGQPAVPFASMRAALIHWGIRHTGLAGYATAIGGRCYSVTPSHLRVEFTVARPVDGPIVCDECAFRFEEQSAARRHWHETHEDLRDCEIVSVGDGTNSMRRRNPAADRRVPADNRVSAPEQRPVSPFADDFDAPVAAATSAATATAASATGATAATPAMLAATAAATAMLAATAPNVPRASRPTLLTAAAVASRPVLMLPDVFQPGDLVRSLVDALLEVDSRALVRPQINETLSQVHRMTPQELTAAKAEVMRDNKVVAAVSARLRAEHAKIAAAIAVLDRAMSLQYAIIGGCVMRLEPKDDE